MENIEKNWRIHVPFMLSAAILAQWQHLVASSEALDRLYWAIRAVLYQRIAMVIKTTSKVGVFVDCWLFACCPAAAGGYGSSSHLMVASSGFRGSPRYAALGELSVLLRCIGKAFEMSSNGGAF
jgi:hypothetical protein